MYIVNLRWFNWSYPSLNCFHFRLLSRSIKTFEHYRSKYKMSRIWASHKICIRFCRLRNMKITDYGNVNIEPNTMLYSQLNGCHSLSWETHRHSDECSVIDLRISRILWIELNSRIILLITGPILFITRLQNAWQL
jgi:hypothetical protein